MGASRNGYGIRRPKISTLVSRSETSRSIRGTIRQRPNASRFARIVSESPAPAATYAYAFSLMAASARRSSSAGSTGTRGRRPLMPLT